MKPSEKAEIATLKATIRAIQKGATVSKPVTEGTRYDLILDYQGRLYRAQVKYCGSTDQPGAVWVRLASGSYGRIRFQAYSAHEVDVVLAYVPSSDVILWIDACHFDGKGALSFRLQKALNNQSKGCRLIEDFIW
ncbi:MAG: hypothetical protein JO250_20010 [Armatimonadetes bacterium]|nr:hypothetical protein [Armatimonadota bacterium]